MNIPEISVQELEELKKKKAKFLILDVRDPWEYEEANLGGLLIPLRELPERLDELNPKDLIVVHCQAGGRASKAVAYLLDQGFVHVKNLRGGLQEWLKQYGPKNPDE